MALKMDFGILYYEDQRPPYRKLVTIGGRSTVIFGRFLGLIEDRCECKRRCGWLHTERVETAATTFCSA
jgi:hypothetical protein